MMQLEGTPLFRAITAGFFEIRQVALLACIVDQPGLSVRDYSNRVQINRPSVTRAVNSMVEAGLIDRKQGVRDRRLCVLVPTEHGTDLIREVFGEEQPCISAANAAAS